MKNCLRNFKSLNECDGNERLKMKTIKWETFFSWIKMMNKKNKMKKRKKYNNNKT